MTSTAVGITRPMPTHVELIVGRESPTRSNTSNGVSSSGGRVRCRISAPFSGKAVGHRSLVRPARQRQPDRAVGKRRRGASASVAAPAVPRNCRREASERGRNIFSMVSDLVRTPIAMYPSAGRLT